MSELVKKYIFKIRLKNVMKYAHRDIFSITIFKHKGQN